MNPSSAKSDLCCSLRPSMIPWAAWSELFFQAQRTCVPDTAQLMDCQDFTFVGWLISCFDEQGRNNCFGSDIGNLAWKGLTIWAIGLF